MSDHNKFDPAEEAKRYSEFKLKEIEVKTAKVDREYESLLKSREDVKNYEKLDLFTRTGDYIDKLLGKSIKKQESAVKKMNFLQCNKELNALLPFYAHEMFLVMARTGSGKTTASRNVAYSALIQNRKPCVITNEETADDFLNGVTSLFIGKRYGNLANLDDETKKRLNESLPKVAKRMTVIDAEYAVDNGINLPGLTNSIEGLELILTKLMDQYRNNGSIYDVVIIDYYQKFNFSIKNPALETYKCQEQAANLLENFRKNYPAPMVVFSQMTKNVEKEAPYEMKVEGRKVIANYATVVVEMETNRKERNTNFIIHKGRNMEYIDGDIMVGYDNGKFVEYDEAFKKRINDATLVRMGIKEEEAKDGKSDETGTSGAITTDPGKQEQVPKTD